MAKRQTQRRVAKTRMAMRFAGTAAEHPALKVHEKVPRMRHKLRQLLPPKPPANTACAKLTYS